MRIDLHAHSRASDGLLTPTALVHHAQSHGVTHLALTDHDTVDGVPEARTAAAACGMTLLPGLEATGQLHGREVHVLLLGVDIGAPPLVRFCAEVRAERATRIERMVEALQRHRVDITLQQVLDEAAGATLARPHLARVLVQRGHAASREEAFRNFLEPGTPGHVERSRPEVPALVRLARSAGGITSLAHPGVCRVSRQELSLLAAEGLDAVECDHPSQVPTQVDAYARWSAELGMLRTGGADFHGSGDDGGPPGYRTTSPAAWERICEVVSSRGGVSA